MSDVTKPDPRLKEVYALLAGAHSLGVAGGNSLVPRTSTWTDPAEDDPVLGLIATAFGLVEDILYSEGDKDE